MSISDDLDAGRTVQRQSLEGFTINMRQVRECHVERMFFETGTLTHAVRGAMLEWPPGRPTEARIRYLLACGDVRQQRRIGIKPPTAEVTCSRCRKRLGLPARTGEAWSVRNSADSPSWQGRSAPTDPVTTDHTPPTASSAEATGST